MASYYWYFDSTKARDELGFAARDAADTLYDTVTYLRENIIGRRPLVVAAGPPAARSEAQAQDAGAASRRSPAGARGLAVELDGDLAPNRRPA